MLLPGFAYFTKSCLLLATPSSNAAILSNIVSERALRRCHNNGRAVQAAYRLEKRAADIEPHTDRFAQIRPPRFVPASLRNLCHRNGGAAAGRVGCVVSGSVAAECGKCLP